MSINYSADRSRVTRRRPPAPVRRVVVAAAPTTTPPPPPRRPRPREEVEPWTGRRAPRHQVRSARAACLVNSLADRKSDQTVAASDDV